MEARDGSSECAGSTIPTARISSRGLRHKEAEGEFARHSTEFDDESAFIEGAFLDLGTAAATLALNAAGCPTISSCNGSHGHRYDYPTVAFFAPEAKLTLLRQAAEAARVGLLTDDEGWVEVFSDVPDGLLRFAAEMRTRSSAFRNAG